MIERTVVSPFLRKPTGTIQIGNQFSFTERKLLNTLIWHSQKNERVTGSEQILPIVEVFRAIGWTKSKNKEDLKRAVRKLAGTTVEWNEFGEDRTQMWTVCTFLSSGKITKSHLKYRLNPEIVSQINHPSLYAKMQLLIQGLFNKRHSLILYEFFLDFISRRQERHLVLEKVELEVIYKLLGLKDSSYAVKGGYRFFNRDILKPSIREINECSDLEVGVKAHRRGRSVYALDFSVKRKTSFQVNFDFAKKALTQDVRAAREAEDGSLKQQLVDQGVAEKQAAQLCEEYNADRIAEKLTYLEEQIKGGKKIINVGAWLRCAIEEDYRSKASTAARSKERVDDQAEAMQKAAEKGREALEREWSQFRGQKAREKYAQKPKAWQQKQLKAFEKSGKLSSHLFRKRYAEEGLENSIIAALFYTGLYALLLTEPHETDIEAYAVWRNPKAA